MNSYDRDVSREWADLAKRALGVNTYPVDYGPRNRSAPVSQGGDANPAESARAVKAASILAEERKLRGEDAVRSGPEGQAQEWRNATPTMELLRRQAGDLVSTMVEVLGRSGGPRPEAGGIADGERLLRGDPPGALLLSPAVVGPGQAGEIVLTLENEDTSEPAMCAFFASDLVANSGSRIPAPQIRASPSPARIPPGGSIDVRVEIRVPSGTPAGNYAGLLQTDDAAQPPVVLQVRVAG